MKKVLLVCAIGAFLYSCGGPDVCKCLNEPGDSEFMKENADACDEAISDEIGVDDWQSVNFGSDKEAADKFDEMVQNCKK
jgi:hypothetical protein